MLYILGGAAPVAGMPLVPGIDASPPHALGNLIAGQQGVEDISNGHAQTFRVASLHDLNIIIGVLQGSAQFRRVGPTTAALSHVEQQLPLVTFAISTLIKGAVQLLPNFYNLP